jgi:hypothetical protein
MILNKNKKNIDGQVMMIVVLVLSGIIIGATGVAGLLTARQTRQSADSGSSIVAISAADAGLEWGMYKLYEDWKNGSETWQTNNLVMGNDCFDCTASAIACDKKPAFIDNAEKINNVDVRAEVSCRTIPGPDPDNYLYFKINSTGKVQGTSYLFEQTIKLSK